MADFRNLQAWRLAHELVLEVDRVSGSFPGAERFGLTAQVRGSAAAIPANIAEGAERRSDRDFARFVAMAMASASETEYHLLLARDLGYLTESQWSQTTDLTRRARSMLARLHGSLIRRSDPSGSG